MEKVCGLDVHKDSVFMCILNEKGEKTEEKFGTLTPDLDRLRDLLVSHSVGKVAMESTSIYWIPLWRVLHADFDVKLVNPYFIKQLPGRKSDVKDAQWIAMVLQKELIKGSYIPEPKIQELRQYERRNAFLGKRLVHAEQGIDMQLQRCNIRLSNYVSDVGGLSMRKVVKALICGETNPDVLVKLVHGRTINKHGIEIIKSALTGILSNADRDMLRLYMEEIELYEKQKEECQAKMAEICEEYFAEQEALLKTIPGVKKLSAMSIIAELGVNMDAFLTASAVVGWAGLKPRNEESAGKIKSRKTLHGNKYLRVMLVQCAWAACRTKGSEFAIKFNALSKRMNHNKALIANARKLLVIIWNLLSKKETYRKAVA